MPDHYCDKCGEVDYDCRCDPRCPHCDDPPQWDSDKLSCSCTVYEINDR
jgi:hypothetical protein